MQQILKCMSCNTHLSSPVWIYDEALGKRKRNKGWARIPPPEGSNLYEITMRDGFGDYLCPRGTALKYQNAKQHSQIKDLWYAIRTDSLSEAAQRNGHWKIECCGVYPGTKPNLSCKCGLPFGLEFGDCFTQKYVLPLPRKTKWQNVKS